MNVRSERMSVSARFSDTAQLGRVCKKSVRPSGRGVQGLIGVGILFRTYAVELETVS